MSEWQVWEGFPFKVAQRQFSDWAGSGYKLARNRFGFFKRFLTRAAAQRYADRLNDVGLEYAIDKAISALAASVSSASEEGGNG